MKKIRKKYSKQFKIDAVNLVLKQGFNIAEAARNLDINQGLLGKGKKNLKKIRNKLCNGSANWHSYDEVFSD